VAAPNLGRVSDWAELLLLAIASMFWPTLILVDVLAFRLPRPIPILAAFLAGGLLTTIVIGIVIVFFLQGSSLTGSSRPAFDPAVYLTAGALAVGAGYVLNRSRAKPREQNESSAAARAVGGGLAVAFVAGVVLDIAPGVFPFVALTRIAELDATTGAKVVAIVVFYVIMFAFIEVPIVSYAVAPARTTTAIADFNAWLDRNGRLAGVVALVVVGVYLLVRGLVMLA
jgi:hypothetical protein